MRFLGFVDDRSTARSALRGKTGTLTNNSGGFFFFSCNFEKIPGANALSLVISTT